MVERGCTWRWAAHSVLMVADMLKHGTKINQQDSSGYTALHSAIKSLSNSLDLIQLLIDNGANGMLKTKDNVSCYFLAVDRGDPKILDIVLPKTTSPSDPTWEPEDLAPAFWRALELHAMSVETAETARLKYADMVISLANKAPALLALESEENLTGLEICLSTRSKRGQDEALAIRLLELTPAASPVPAAGQTAPPPSNWPSPRAASPRPASCAFAPSAHYRPAAPRQPRPGPSGSRRYGPRRSWTVQMRTWRHCGSGSSRCGSGSAARRMPTGGALTL